MVSGYNAPLRMELRGQRLPRGALSTYVKKRSGPSVEGGTRGERPNMRGVGARGVYKCLEKKWVLSGVVPQGSRKGAPGVL